MSGRHAAKLHDNNNKKRRSWQNNLGLGGDAVQADCDTLKVNKTVFRCAVICLLVTGVVVSVD